ncbi:hypothetical protein AMS68_001971 [Peltaster fructicola]|uniref:Copper-fist domain-containing protein n=1 Tax=Peltaster fructicola TaxID=286661 RepID=A0A6H0XP03_9PEZI|nr:hypothetical protein AMS68_001971 [Peltaster fructicola]
MEQDKPFKTIEVIDNDTKQVCKIACMSCIRGHRTTSCGIPVCRTKIFWTVKRPGRPSNSCTCRFHSSGVCKCVTALPKCPHKSKKGEKRTSECRCDEQGRFCCLLEPEHWDKLMQLQKPNVQFFPSREALEGWQMQSPVANVETNLYNMTPQRTGSCCGSVTTQSTPQMSRSIAPTPSDVTSPQASTITPRFGFMGVGAPMGPNHTSPDVMTWTGDTPIASSEYHSPESALPEVSAQSSCCQSKAYTPPATSHTYVESAYQPVFDGYSHYPGTSMAPQPTFDFDRWNQNYQIYQFPNAICQNCGLNGCTCRSCPPLMQNFQNTSWAQSCGRRHARIAPMPPANQQQPHMQQIAPLIQPQHQSLPQLHSTQTPHLHHTQPSSMQMLPLHAAHSPTPALEDHMQSTQPQHMQSPSIPILPIHAAPSPTSTLRDYIFPPQTPDPLLYSDFVTHELDRPGHVPDEYMFNG